MNPLSFFILFLFAFNASLLLFVVIGLCRINKQEGIFYRILTPIETPPGKVRELTSNKRVVITGTTLFCVMLFWIICPFPEHSWAGVFLMSAYYVLTITFLCFRRLLPDQFILICFVLNTPLLSESILGHWGFSTGRLIMMYLLSILSLMMTYLANRYILSRIFKTERITAIISIAVLFFLEFRSLMLIVDLSYHLQRLGWY